MGYEWFIALRYLRAKKKPTFLSVISAISILGITVGVMALIIVLSVMTGFEEDLKKKILGMNSHLILSEFGLKNSMTNYRELNDKVAKVEGVTGSSPFIYSQGLLSSGDSVTGVVIRGLDLSTYSKVIVLDEKIKAGSIEGLKVGFKEAAGSGKLPGIMIGNELARSLGVRLGDEVNMISPTASRALAGAAPRMASFKVAGIFSVGMYEYDSSLAFVSLENAQTFFRLGNTVSGIEVTVKDIYAAPDIGKRIRESIDPTLSIKTWMDMNKNLMAALKLEKVAMFIILSLIIIVAALNIISTLIMTVMQKGKEIAILKSIGATSGGIMKIFMIEGAIVGVIGTTLGTVLGILCATNLEAILLFLENTFGFRILQPSVYYIDRLPSKTEPEFVIAIIAISLAISFLATIYPSWKASRLDPVEGLRYE
ncbi:MAG: lipoprotein-releasing ABC transporter permease subunit [Deltaproteobacteria bacterium]|nr:lipoprotein-releasing ABC transporter permease subunit [Deltaproteobacteria bacterium]